MLKLRFRPEEYDGGRLVCAYGVDQKNAHEFHATL